jgi:glucoamylase
MRFGHRLFSGLHHHAFNSAAGIAAFVLTLANASSLNAQVYSPADLADWTRLQSQRSLEQILKNIDFASSIPGALPGNVVASPGSAFDKENGEKQDYRFHWIRDGALVARTLLMALDSADLTELQKSRIEKFFGDYISLSRVHQRTPSHLGEPKFYLNGNPFKGPWGRPQNDGAALRQLAILDWLERLRRSGNVYKLAKAKSIFREVSRKDLNFLVTVTEDPSFDFWEEVYGEHFPVMEVQAAALENGSRFAAFIGDHEGEIRYKRAAVRLRERMLAFYSQSKKYIEVSHNQIAGHVTDKTSGLDSVLLISHHLAGGRFFSPSWMGTVVALVRAFVSEYPINRMGLPGVLLGRYPEDRYFGGNPWPITTLGLVKAYLSMALEIDQIMAGGPIVLPSDDMTKSFLQILGLPLTATAEALKTKLLQEADAILGRVRFHSGSNGELYEQFDRNIGYLAALPDLTWSHAEMLETILYRNDVLKSLNPPTCEDAFEK